MINGTSPTQNTGSTHWVDHDRRFVYRLSMQSAIFSLQIFKETRERKTKCLEASALLQLNQVQSGFRLFPRLSFWCTAAGFFSPVFVYESLHQWKELCVIFPPLLVSKYSWAIFVYNLVHIIFLVSSDWNQTFLSPFPLGVASQLDRQAVRSSRHSLKYWKREC